MKTADLDRLCIDTIRTLSMDAVQKAKSGHPGTPMALAAPAWVLWSRFLRHNPSNPAWFDRDRFVLSNGHASMLLYSLLFLTGYDLSSDDIKSFRQWGSRTPGHPEHAVVPGAETTTGPLGQGLMTAVGMALAEAHLSATFNRPGHDIVDHFTYVFCGDGDLMEGASHEAGSLAGHLGLGKLIVLYDDNRISIEGGTALAFSDDTPARFRAYGWDVIEIGDAAEDLEALSDALRQAREEGDRPSLIVVRSHIGYGSPGRQDTPEAHGEPLGAEEVRLAKRFYGWPEEAEFFVPGEVSPRREEERERGERLEREWRERLVRYREAYPEEAASLEAAIAGELPVGWESALPRFEPGASVATRTASGKAINALAEKLPFVVGGSADLAPSTKTFIAGSPYMKRGDFRGRNIAWGVREHLMCAATSGLTLHGGLRPFAATFFAFSDYARPAIRLAALMGLPALYVFTHDSIGLGEDGPTHQPVEHLASFRAMPGICVIRPADANETVRAWRVALLRRNGPTMLVLSRQNLPVLPETAEKGEGLQRGGYVLARETGSMPDLILMASGSEVHLVLAARESLARDGIDARVVSLPSWELFREQPEEYRADVLPPAVKARLAVEAGSPQGWREWIGDAGEVIGVETFGASAPGEVAMGRYGFTVENVVTRGKRLVGR
jgi:transketolase